VRDKTIDEIFINDTVNLLTKEKAMNTQEKELIMKVFREKAMIATQKALREEYANRQVYTKPFTLMGLFDEHPRICLVSIAPITMAVVGVINSLLG